MARSHEVHPKPRPITAGTKRVYRAILKLADVHHRHGGRELSAEGLNDAFERLLADNPARLMQQQRRAGEEHNVESMHKMARNLWSKHARSQVKSSHKKFGYRWLFVYGSDGLDARFLSDIEYGINSDPDITVTVDEKLLNTDPADADSDQLQTSSPGSAEKPNLRKRKQINYGNTCVEDSAEEPPNTPSAGSGSSEGAPLEMSPSAQKKLKLSTAVVDPSRTSQATVKHQRRKKGSQARHSAEASSSSFHLARASESTLPDAPPFSAISANASVQPYGQSPPPQNDSNHVCASTEISDSDELDQAPHLRLHFIGTAATLASGTPSFSHESYHTTLDEQQLSGEGHSPRASAVAKQADQTSIIPVESANGRHDASDQSMGHAPPQGSFAHPSRPVSSKSDAPIPPAIRRPLPGQLQEGESPPRLEPYYDANQLETSLRRLWRDAQQAIVDFFQNSPLRLRPNNCGINGKPTASLRRLYEIITCSNDLGHVLPTGQGWMQNDSVQHRHILSALILAGIEELVLRRETPAPWTDPMKRFEGDDSDSIHWAAHQTGMELPKLSRYARLSRADLEIVPDAITQHAATLSAELMEAINPHIQYLYADLKDSPPHEMQAVKERLPELQRQIADIMRNALQLKERVLATCPCARLVFYQGHEPNARRMEGLDGADDNRFQYNGGYVDLTVQPGLEYAGDVVPGYPPRPLVRAKVIMRR